VCVLSPSCTDIRAKSAFTGILAQSDAIRFVNKKLKSPVLAAIAKKSLKELKLGSNKVLCVKGSKTVLEALKAMLKFHYNSVAVVDDKNEKLISSLTFAHIQYLFRTKLYSSMNTKVGDFLNKLNSEQKEEQSDATFYSVNLETSLADCVKRVVDLNLHRVWVVDAHNHPIGVVTLRDMLCALTPSTASRS